jgi:branched-subunit amino acid aminotransferase/4-amino-4-deoxychorismate lyase
VPSAIQINKLKPLIAELLQENKLLNRDATVRLQVWRDGTRGYLPDSETQSHFLVTASACPESFDYPKLVTVDKRRIPEEALPSNYKHTNGINYILAAREADEKGGDDALMQTVDGWISETTIANVFWIKGNWVFTPSTDCDLLPGITRQVIIGLIKQHKLLKLNEGAFELDHILDADAAWICNSGREIMPVKQIEGQSLDVNHGTITELKQRFVTFRDKNLKSL